MRQGTQDLVSNLIDRELVIYLKLVKIKDILKMIEVTLPDPYHLSVSEYIKLLGTERIL